MAIDQNTYSTSGVSNPAGEALEITPADIDLATFTRGVYIGVAGDLKVTMAGGDVVTFVGVVAGSVLPIRCSQIMAATTASSIVALY